MILRPRVSAVTALLCLLPLAGRESFGRGMTQAVLEGTQGEREGTQSCEVEGRPFAGVEPYLAKQDRLPPFTEAGVGDRPEVKCLPSAPVRRIEAFTNGGWLVHRSSQERR
jgi:hypothetical protein